MHPPRPRVALEIKSHRRFSAKKDRTEQGTARGQAVKAKSRKLTPRSARILWLLSSSWWARDRGRGCVTPGGLLAGAASRYLHPLLPGAQVPGQRPRTVPATGTRPRKTKVKPSLDEWRDGIHGASQPAFPLLLCV